MLILVTNPEAMAKGFLAKTFYTIPESVGEMARINEYGAWVEEAEHLEAKEAYGASQARQKALKLLLRIWEETPNADCVDVLKMLKPEFRFGRPYAVAMVGKLMQGSATKQDMKVFKAGLLRRLQTARYNLKNLRQRAGERWAVNLAAGRTS